MVSPKKAAARWASLMETWLAWHGLATMQALCWEGDAGQASSWYTWESSWALQHPDPDL